MSIVNQAIKQLVQRAYVTFHARCNEAILLALQYAKTQGYACVHIPDSGGWMYYESLATKAGLSVAYIKTQDGYFSPADLSLTSKDVLLAHSLAGYYRRLPTKEIATYAKNMGALYIEDACGILGEEVFGHILVGSFGKAKPIPYGQGGFLATNDKNLAAFAQTTSIELEDPLLCTLISSVNEKKKQLVDIRKRIQTLLDTQGFKSIADETALVCIVPYETELQKEHICALLTSEGVPFTLCPRYIRSSLNAVCAEIKKLA